MKSFLRRSGHHGAGFKSARRSGKYIGQGALPVNGQLSDLRITD